MILTFWIARRRLFLLLEIMSNKTESRQAHISDSDEEGEFDIDTDEEILMLDGEMMVKFERRQAKKWRGKLKNKKRNKNKVKDEERKKLDKK